MKLIESSKPPKKLKFPITVRQVQGHSMLPVLPPGTVVYGIKWFRRKKLKIGDIVIFQHNDREKLKRIEKVDDGRIYVIGDHPVDSLDSRDFGWVHINEVLAKVVWPHAPKHRAEGVDPYP